MEQKQVVGYQLSLEFDISGLGSTCPSRNSADVHQAADQAVRQVDDATVVKPGLMYNMIELVCK